MLFKHTYCRVLTIKISALNFYSCNFNGRAVPWAFPLEFVCKSRVESGVQCVTNGAETGIGMVYTLF